MTIRYDLQYGAIEEYEFGDYVTYSEYQDVESELEDLQKKYQKLVDSIQSIYMET